MRIELGEKVRDKITGIEGIATSRTEFLNGCVQYEVTRKISKKEALTVESVQGISIDEQQLEVIGRKKLRIKRAKITERSYEGGPMRVRAFGKR